MRGSPVNVKTTSAARRNEDPQEDEIKVARKGTLSWFFGDRRRKASPPPRSINVAPAPVRLLFFLVPGLYASELIETANVTGDGGKRRNKIGKVRFPPTPCKLTWHYLMRKIRGQNGSTAWDRNVQKIANNEPKLRASGRIIRRYAGVAVYSAIAELVRRLERTLYYESETRRYYGCARVIECAYDWRAPLQETIRRVIEFIKLHLSMAQYAEANVIFYGHSLGGFIVRAMRDTPGFEQELYQRRSQRASIFIMHSAPLFGIHGLFNLYALEKKCSREGDGTLSRERIRHDKRAARFYRGNIFFTPEHQRVLFRASRAGFVPLLRLNEVRVQDEAHLRETADVLDMTPRDTLQLHEQLARNGLVTGDNLSQNLTIVCHNVGGVVHGDPIGHERVFAGDGTIHFAAEDFQYLRRVQNLIEIRDVDSELDHLQSLKSPYILTTLETILRTTLKKMDARYYAFSNYATRDLGVE